MSDNPERCAHYLKLIRLIVDVGTDSVRDVFYCYKPRERVASFFASDTIYKELLELKQRHVITAEQFENLTCDPNPEELDISLLITIIVNLFKWTVEPPKNGWDKPLGDDDSSLGACLLRLKKLRNSLVGHSADARLSTEEFETLWEQAECILRQIACFTKNDKIDEVIQAYRSSPLELDETKDDKYIVLLRQWYEEGVSALASLQKEVEDLCKKTTEFELFFRSNIPERYKRYVLLLFEGGMTVLAGLMKRELKKEGTDLISLLILNIASIHSKCIGDSSDRIYKGNTIETDVSQWGLQLLTTVILCLFRHKLNMMEIKAVSDIGEAHADFARIAKISLDSDKFRPYWTDIVSNINILSAVLDYDTQVACQDLIKKHDTGPIDESIVHNYLLQLRQDCHPLQTAIHQYLDAREKLKHAVEQMQREGACFGHDQVLELKMIAHGKTEEKRKLAENILHTVFEKAEALSDDSRNFKAIKEAVEKILQGIKELPEVKITSVEKHCIVLSIECSSCTGCLALLDFIESSPFTDHIQSFSRSLTEYCGEQIIVTAFITIDSILKTMETLHVNGAESSIGIKLSCSSVDAIRRLQQIVQSDETTNHVNNIAQALSEKLKEKISIETSLDMGGFDDIDFDENEELTRRHPLNTSSTHLGSILADIKEDIKAAEQTRGIELGRIIKNGAHAAIVSYNESPFQWLPVDIDNLLKSFEPSNIESSGNVCEDNLPGISGTSRKRRLSSFELKPVEIPSSSKRAKEASFHGNNQHAFTRSRSLPCLSQFSDEEIQLSVLQRQINHSISCETFERKDEPVVFTSGLCEHGKDQDYASSPTKVIKCEERILSSHVDKSFVIQKYLISNEESATMSSMFCQTGSSESLDSIGSFESSLSNMSIRSFF